MSPTPRRSIDPTFLEGLSCPICGRDSLELKIMDRFPDYVSCSNCQSQFVTEEAGERVMYGKIPASYPRTSRFALQQWVWPEAVARRADEERPPKQSVSPPPPLDAPPEPELDDTPPEADEPSMESPVDEPRDRLTIDSELEPEPAEPEFETSSDEAWSPGLDEPVGAQAPLDSEEADLWPEDDDQPWPSLADESSQRPLDVFGDAADSPEHEAAFDLMTGEPDQPASPPDSTESDLPGWPPEPESKADSQPEPAWPPAPSAAETEAWFESEVEDSDEVLPEPEPETAERSSYTPPFGAGADTPEAELPGDFEPAPPMPPWLSSESQAEAMAEEQEAAPAPTEDEEDLLAALWGEETQTPPGQPDSALSFEDVASDEPAEAMAPAESDADWSDESFLEGLDFEDDEPGAPAVTSPALADEAEQQPSQVAMQSTAAYWAGSAAAKPAEPEPAAPPAAEDSEAGAVVRPAEEPEPGLRYRVVLSNSQPTFPKDMCAHCTQSPASARLAHTATVYRGSGLGERQVVTYRVPICADCQARHTAQSEEAANARLQAHLVSVLAALVLVIGAMALRVVDFQDSLALDLAILLVLALMGYIVPAAFLLIRASRFQRPADAVYVGSTLRVPADTEGVDTAFEWRNQTYARRFHALNKDQASGNVTKVRERSYEGPLS